MTDAAPPNIRQRLDALYMDLAGSSPEIPCPPQIARVFNALLTEARQQFETDPVLRAINVLRPDGDGGTLPSVRTVQTLVGQLRVVFGQDGRGAGGADDAAP